jgi:predicted dienelactone hydrolase
MSTEAAATTLAYSAPSGPFPVGVCDGEFTDTVHPPVRASEADGRRCSVRVWYPADSAEGERRRYFTERELEVAGTFMAGEPPLLPPAWMSRLGEILTHSHIGARPAPGTFPTVVYSHGLGSYLGQNLALMEHLASHGYVVLGIGHPGESGGIEYPDGSVATVAEDLKAGIAALGLTPEALERITGDVPTRLARTRDNVDDKGLGPWSRRWVADTTALLDALWGGTLIGVPAEVVAACDQKRLGSIGMSFGACSAVSAAHADSRFAAAVNLDGGHNLSDLLDTDVRVPLLELTHDAFASYAGTGIEVQALHYNELFFEPLATTGTRQDVVRLRIPDVAHMELMDLSFFPPEERAQAIRGGGRMSSERLNAIVNTLVAAHFDHFLKGSDNGYPAAQVVAFSELQPVDLSPLREGSSQPA